MRRHRTLVTGLALAVLSVPVLAVAAAVQAAETPRRGGVPARAIAAERAESGSAPGAEPSPHRDGAPLLQYLIQTEPAQLPGRSSATRPREWKIASTGSPIVKLRQGSGSMTARR